MHSISMHHSIRPPLISTSPSTPPRYPFERSSDRQSTAKEADRCQLMLKRILKADFEYPRSRQVSPECKDLIDKILVADPDVRLGVPEIQEHAWFKKGLPKGYLEYNDQALQIEVTSVQPPEEIKRIIALAKTPDGDLQDVRASGRGVHACGVQYLHVLLCMHVCWCLCICCYYTPLCTNPTD